MRSSGFSIFFDRAMSGKSRVEFLKTLDHPDRVDEIIALVTDAYAVSPVFLYMFGEDGVRRGLDALNAQRLEEAGPNSLFWLDASGRVEGHLVLKPPGPDGPSAMNKTGAAAGEETLLDDASARRRRLVFEAFMGHRNVVFETFPPVDQTWGLSMVALHAECMGLGIGSRAMRQVLAEHVEPLAASGSSIRVNCMSQMERNLAFYQRLGFDDVGNTRLRHDSDPSMDVPNWILSKVYPGAGAVAA